MKVRLALAMCIVLWLRPGAVAGAQAEDGLPKGSNLREARLVGPARVAQEGGREVMAASRFSAGVLDAGPLRDCTIAFRYRHANGLADIVLGPKGIDRLGPVYHVMLRNDAVVLARETPRGTQEPKTGPFAFQPGTWYDVAIQRGGGRFRVAVGAQTVLDVADAETEAADLVAFGSLAGEGFAFSDVRVTAHGAEEVAGALRSGETIYGTADPESLRGWTLAAGSRFEPLGLGRGRPLGLAQKLQAAPGAEAIWTRAAAADYTLVFSFLPGRGTGLVGLQRSGRPPQAREYRLRLAPDRVALSRFADGQERELGAAPVSLLPDRWYNATVHASSGWIHVALDWREVLRVEDPQPLPAGNQVFCSSGGQEIAYAEVRLTFLEPKRAHYIRRLIERQEPKKEPAAEPPSKAQLAPQVVPLQVARYQYPGGCTLAPCTINPGEIPPNFVHTWVLDLKDMDAFQLYTKGAADILLDKGDCITIYALAGLKKQPPQPLVPPILAASKTEALTVDVSNVPSDHVMNGKSYRRVYLKLETSAAYAPRRFVLRGLANLGTKKGTEEALVLADDIDYSGNAIGDYLDPQMKKHAISPPWKKGAQTNWNTYPKPDPADGWFLVAKNLSDATPHFYTLVYYNERYAILRLFLLNLGMPSNVSGATATLSLRGYVVTKQDPVTQKTYLDKGPLTGAFFPLHPNVTRWSSITVPLVEWLGGSWACADIPVLYPMGENLPVDAAKASTQPPNYYRSLYEEPLEKGRREILLSVVVNTYDYGKLEGELTGKAVGTALEKLKAGGGGSDDFFIKFAQFAGKAFSTAGSIYEGANKIYEGVKKYYTDTKNSDPKTSGLKELGSLISMGSSVFSGGLGIANAVMSFIDMISGTQKEPLQLSIELDLKGYLKGTVLIKHEMGYSWFCRLPGRFPIAEAYAEGLVLEDPELTAAAVPRYDRTLGLFGFRYHPRHVTFTVDNSNKGKDMLMGMAYPAVPSPGLPQNWTWDLALAAISSMIDRTKPLARGNVSEWLPIIYNPFAEIVPIRPLIVKTETCRNGSEMDSRWHFDLSWKAHVTPEPGDTAFPQNVVLDYKDGPDFTVCVYHAVESVGGIQSSKGFRTGFRSDWPRDPALDGPWPKPDTPDSPNDPNGRRIQVIPYHSYVPKTYKTFKDIQYPLVDRWYSAWIVCDDKKLAPGDPYPLDSVVYSWDIPYFYYSRTRKNDNGEVPRSLGRLVAHLRAPVGLYVTRIVEDKATKTWGLEHDDAPSMLLRQGDENP